jgi:hypothetical protein
MPHPASDCFPKFSHITITIDDIIALCGRRFIITPLMLQLPELLTGDLKKLGVSPIPASQAGVSRSAPALIEAASADPVTQVPFFHRKPAPE